MEGEEMRLPPEDIEIGMWIRVPGKPVLTGCGIVLDIGESKGRRQLGVLLEYPPVTHVYEILLLYRHEFIEVEQ
jgi:hypothetical protein